MAHRLGYAILCAAIAGGCATSATPAPAEGVAAAAPDVGAEAPPVLTSYTAAQADEGRRVFDTVCSACHGTSEFRNRIFELTWMARPIGHFLDHISTAMPEDRPGALAPAEYAAVVAYVLQMNGRLPGEVEFPADTEALGQVPW